MVQLQHLVKQILVQTIMEAEVAVILVQHLVTKTYILLVNVHGTYSTDVLKLVNQLVLIGQMQNIGQVMQQQMVIQ